MRALRKALFWCHLAAGAVAGAVILVLCATGVLLAFQPQVLRLVERPGLPSSAASVSRASVSERERSSGWPARPPPATFPTAVTVSADPTEPAAVAFGRERALFLDARNGLRPREQLARLARILREDTGPAPLARVRREGPRRPERP